MKEIKFRAWVWNKEMENIDYIHNGKPKWFDIESGDLSSYNDDAVLMQFTGLKDKNGIEIFEGDIVKVYWDDTGEVEAIDSVLWNDNGHWEWNGRVCPKLAFTEDKTVAEVIGNIYETPEKL